MLGRLRGSAALLLLPLSPAPAPRLPPCQDTPGFGDDLNIMNNINTMLEYIEKQNTKWLQVRHRAARRAHAMAAGGAPACPQQQPARAPLGSARG